MRQEEGGGGREGGKGVMKRGEEGVVVKRRRLTKEKIEDTRRGTKGGRGEDERYWRKKGRDRRG